SLHCSAAPPHLPSFPTRRSSDLVKAITLGETPVPMLYTPFRDLPDGGITVFVHTAGAPGPTLAEVHRIVRNIDNHISITYEKTVAQHLAFALWPSWMGAVLLGILGLLA